MNILHVTTSFSFAGAEQIILDLAKGPWTIEVAALTPGDGEFCTRLKQRNITTHDLSMSSKMDWGVLWRLRHLVREGSFDLVHSHLVHANTIARTALRKCPIPVISTLHIVERRFRPWHTWAERLTAPWAAAITAVSREVFEHACRLRLPENKLHEIPNGIDTNHFTPTSPTSPHRVSRDLDILFVGRLDCQKGLDRLLPVLGRMQNGNPVAIAIVGKGPQEENLKAQAAGWGLSAHWAGFVEDTAPWYRRAKVVVVPSRWEGFGLTAAEALACGCDLWHSGVDSLPIVAGDYGRYLPRDPENCTAALIEAVNNFSENDSRRAHVVTHWSAQRMIDDYQGLYRKLSCAALQG